MKKPFTNNFLESFAVIYEIVGKGFSLIIHRGWRVVNYVAGKKFSSLSWVVFRLYSFKTLRMIFRLSFVVVIIFPVFFFPINKNFHGRFLMEGLYILLHSSLRRTTRFFNISIYYLAYSFQLTWVISFNKFDYCFCRFY